MITAMDHAGRIVLPKPLRDLAGLRPGDPLEVTYRDGRIEIEPAPRQVRITARGGLRVAEPASGHATLDEATVRKTREQVRTGRKGS